MRRVQTAGSAETKKREIARIVSAFDGDQPDRLLHVVVHNVHDALREFFEASPLPCPAKHIQRRFNALLRQWHRSTQKEARQQSSEDDVRVGHGKPMALAVTNRSRIATGTLGPNLRGPAATNSAVRSAAASTGGISNNEVPIRLPAIL